MSSFRCARFDLLVAADYCLVNRSKVFEHYLCFQDEQGSTVPKVVASLFLSPGGPKFVNLMLHLANHVMLHEMKTFSTGSKTYTVHSESIQTLTFPHFVMLQPYSKMD